MKQEIDAVVQWMRETVAAAHADGVVFGLSGGIDSAVVAGLSKRAFGDKALGIIMPIDSNPQDEKDARIVAESLDLNVEKVDLTNTFNALVDASFESDVAMAKANVKPRLRTTTLYYYAQDRNYLVCGCSNASEYYIGYFTKYGDSACDLMPIVDFVKSEVVELAKALGLPKEVIEKKPTAGLYAGQTDEDDMGFTYAELDRAVRGNNEGEHKEAIARRHQTSAHKRALPPRFER
ncbi:NAD(+) synthase [Peptoniphilus sp. EMRHCC_23]|uniref:NAD(+) synthase n=1 Tax=Peptoniphilus rachelemmaiella TaxID=2811779 RepID=UPI001C0015AE|nr:NAD(+) synthase [Peptoniphilus rachelemmaiella]